MGRWIFTSLHDVADIIMGQSPDSKYYNSDSHGIPFLQGCAQFGKSIPNTPIYCAVPAKIARIGSILFSVRAPVGEINRADRDYCIGRGVAAIVPKKTNSSYIESYLRLLRPEFDRITQGSTFGSINSRELGSVKVRLPTEQAEQAKIAEVLATVDQTIEQTEALIAKYQRIKTGLMHDLLTRGIDEHGQLRDPATHKFKQSPLGLVSDDWEVKPLRYYLQFISYGFTNPMPEAPEGPYLVTAANVIHGGIDYVSCRHTTQEAFDCLLTDKSRPVKSDILLTKDGTLGRLALVDDHIVCINQSVAVLRVNEKVEARFLKTILEAPVYQDLLLAEAGGSTIKHLYVSRIDKMLLAIPLQSEERQTIFHLIQLQNEVLHNYSDDLLKLQRLKTGLMQDLLTSKVSVEPLLAEEDKA